MVESRLSRHQRCFPSLSSSLYPSHSSLPCTSQRKQQNPIPVVPMQPHCLPSLDCLAKMDGQDTMVLMESRGHPDHKDRQDPPDHNATDEEQRPPGSDSRNMTMQKCCNLWSEHVATSHQVPSTAISTTSQAYTPTDSMPQPTSTPQPTPSPEPLREHVATSCKELYQCNPSGYYNITTPQGAKRVYCDMNTTNCSNITGGWMRAAYIDMTNENNTCPQGLNYTVVSSTRMHTCYHDCSSVTFPTHGVPYTVCCPYTCAHILYSV